MEVVDCQAELPSYESSAWYGVAIRANTPEEIITKLKAADGFSTGASTTWKWVLLMCRTELWAQSDMLAAIAKGRG
jgi:hypothetical protein